MALLSRSYMLPIVRIRESCIRIPTVTVQVRWKKIPIRKPKWLPMAPSKMYRIPQHPYVPPDEKELINDLLEEYFRKIESMRKIFKEELELKAKKSEDSVESQLAAEAQFRSLLEENKKENERIKIIREDTMERLFQEKEIEILELEENRKMKEHEIKMKVEEIVRKEKAKAALLITYDNLDDAIEKAINDPKNFNFAIDVNGDVKWEGNPPAELEEEIRRNVAKSMEN